MEGFISWIILSLKPWGRVAFSVVVRPWSPCCTREPRYIGPCSPGRPSTVLHYSSSNTQKWRIFIFLLHYLSIDWSSNRTDMTVGPVHLCVLWTGFLGGKHSTGLNGAGTWEIMRDLERRCHCTRNWSTKPIERSSCCDLFFFYATFCFFYWERRVGQSVGLGDKIDGVP